MSVIRGVFKHDLTGKMFGTGQNCSFKWGVRLSRVFVRRGSTVPSGNYFSQNIDKVKETSDEDESKSTQHTVVMS